MTNAKTQRSQEVESVPRSSRLGWLLRYGLAVVAVAAAMGLWLGLTAWLGPGLPPYITLYPVVMVVALLGGIGPGVVATVASVVAVDYWVVTPHEFGTRNLAEAVGMGLFSIMGLFMSVVAEFYRRDRHKAAAFDREAALRESQARLAAFAAATFEGIVQSEAGCITDCNEQFAQMLGCSVAELKGVEIAGLIAPEDRDRVMADIRQGRESASEHALLRKDGTRIVVEAHGRSVLPGSARRHTAIRDITERARAQEALRESEERLRLVGDNLPESAVYQYVHETDGRVRFLYVSAGIERLNGISVQAVLRDAGELRRQIPPEYSARLVEAEAQSARKLSDLDMEVPMRRQDGQLRWMRLHSRPRRMPDGRVVWDGVQTDITARKQAETALRESRERLELALLSSRMATFDWDIVKNQRTWSEGVHSLLGTKPETFSGTAEEFFQVIHPEDRSVVQAALARAVETTGVYETEYRAVWPDGSVRHVAARGLVHRDAAGRAIEMTGVCWDITADKQAEAEIRRRAEELRAANEELVRFNRVTVGRELRIIELKKQVNELCARLGQPPRFSETTDGHR